MAQFTVRVELHGATPQQYELLHDRMRQASFVRTIRGVDAAGAAGWWALPTGEYDHESMASASDIRSRVKIIADSVVPGAWVLVTQVADRSWNTVKVQGG